MSSADEPRSASALLSLSHAYSETHRAATAALVIGLQSTACRKFECSAVTDKREEDGFVSYIVL